MKTQPDPGPADPPVWTVHLSGDLAVSRRAAETAEPPVAVPSRQAATVLAVLATERREVTREELAELLWGDATPLPPHWPNAVRIVLSKLRSPLAGLGAGPDAVRSVGGRVSLHLPGGWITDLEAASAALEEAEAVADTDPTTAAEHARAAVHHLSDPMLLDSAAALARQLAEHVASLRARSRHLEIRAALAVGDAGAAAATARVCIEVDPLDETAHHLLIQALLAADLPAAAWRAYSQLAHTLSTELGISPAPRTRALVAGRVHPSRRSARSVVTSGTTQGPLTFLGRRPDLARLQNLWDVVVDGQQPALAVVDGVTGIGKTRLLRELAADLHRRGAQVLWGTAHADSGLPYEPVVDALRRRLVGRARREDDPVPGPALAGLLGLTTDGAPTADLAPLDVSAATRSAVFTDLERVVDALVTIPTLWVIDDIQWASHDSLAFLHLLLETLDLPVMLVVLMRPGAAHVDAAVAQWWHEVPSTSITLDRLTGDDLQPLVDELAGLGDTEQPTTLDGADLADRLLAQTGGHPYLLVEVARSVRQSGRLSLEDAPASARAWIRHRVAALPRPTAALLGLAAVIGERVPIGLLQRCSSTTSEALVGALETLIAEGFLANTDQPDLVVFPHQITHAAVAALVIPAGLAALHLRVADAMIDDGALDPAAVARHLLQAGPEHSARAVRYAVDGAERMLAVGAWAAAEQHLAQIHGLEADPATRAAAAVALGLARHHQGADHDADTSLREAITIARRHRCAPELAAAVLGMVGRGRRGASIGMTDTERVELLTEVLEALERMPPRDDHRDTPELRELLTVKTEGELGWATLFTSSVHDRAELATRGLRRIADRDDVAPELEAHALLNARSVRNEAGDLPVRLAEAERVLALPSERLSAEVRLTAMKVRQEDLLTLGDRRAAREALAVAAEAAQRWSSPHWQWAAATWGSLHAAIDGDIDAAERLLQEATDRAQGPTPEVAACQVVQLICLRLLAGRAIEVLPLISAAADANPHIPCYRAVQALVAVEAGDNRLAEQALSRCAGDGFEAIHHDSNRFLALAVLADVAVDLGSREHAATLLPLLEPWSGRVVVLNCYAGGGAYWGPADRLLARLARLLGDDRADRWFAGAEQIAERIASPWAVQRVRQDRTRGLPDSRVIPESAAT